MVRTACPLDCPDGCSLEAEVVDGRLEQVDAAPADTGDETVNPLTQGFICQKVKRHHRARLQLPAPADAAGADRTQGFGHRGGPLSWDEALDLVAARIAEARAQDPGHGGALPVQLVGGALGSGRLGPLLWEALGASAVDKTICAATAGAGLGADLRRHDRGADLLDVVHADLVVVWGANPAISNTHFPPLVNQARAGAPRWWWSTPDGRPWRRRADLHLALRPGTDVVLALAVAAELDRRGLVDRAFTDAHATGVDEYLAAAGPGRWTGPPTCAGWIADRDRRPGGPGRLAPPGLLAPGLGHGAQPQRRVRPCGPCWPCPC